MADPAARKAVVTVGSVHVDLIATVDHIRVAGESRVGGRFTTAPGGKAGNQAAQAAKCGVPSYIIGRIGIDPFGDQLHVELAAAGIDVTYLVRDPTMPTGASTVLVNEDGEYSSVIVPGAAAALSVADIAAAAPVLARTALLLLQLELPLQASLAAARLAKRYGSRVVLNAAPLSAISRYALSPVLQVSDILVANAAELGALVGSTLNDADLEDAARSLVAEDIGPDLIVITRGAAGAIAVSGGETLSVPALTVRVVDTVGAGDAFLGAFAARLAAGAHVADALRYGTVAGSLATTSPGAMAGQPDHRAIQPRLG